MSCADTNSNFISSWRTETHLLKLRKCRKILVTFSSSMAGEFLSSQWNQRLNWTFVLFCASYHYYKINKYFGWHKLYTVKSISHPFLYLSLIPFYSLFLYLVSLSPIPFYLPSLFLYISRCAARCAAFQKPRNIQNPSTEKVMRRQESLLMEA